MRLFEKPELLKSSPSVGWQTLAPTLVRKAVSTVAFLALLGCTIGTPAITFAQPADDPVVERNNGDERTNAKNENNRIGYRVLIELPVTSQSADRVRQSLKRLIEKTDPVVRPSDRPLVVLEFQTDRGKTGSGSEFEACLSLARLLGSSDINRLNTVAYIPGSMSAAMDAVADDETTGQLNGHAVLIAISADLLAMDQQTAIGLAGFDEKERDPLVIDLYHGIAKRRSRLPVPIVEAMIDSDAELFKVTTARGKVFVGGSELNRLEESGAAIESQTLSPRGKQAKLFSGQLFDDRLIQYRPDSRSELARQLNLRPGSLEGDPTEGKQWRALQINLPPFIDIKTVNWVTRSLQQEIGRRDTNLVILNLNHATGDRDACLQLADHLARYDSAVIRTVAHVHGEAAGPVGLVALSTDHLVLASDAKLGGGLNAALAEPDLQQQEAEGDEALRQDVQRMIREIAKRKQRDWSLLMAMVDSKTTVNRYRNRDTGQVRLLSNDQLQETQDADRWAELGPLDVRGGIDAATAQQLYLARTIADDQDQLKTFYQLAGPVRTLEKSSTDVWIEKVASFLSSPMVTPWLLLGAMFFFSSEMSAPGLGVPGFLSAICLLLFFWSQYLDGNANVLEILLFVAGVMFLMIELFVVPGFGVFGIGGMIMVVAGVVLASQKFLIPRTAAEIAQLPYSLMPLVGAGAGFFIAVFTLRKVLPNSPYFKRMMLDPEARRRRKTGLEDRSDPEAVADFAFLDGSRGKAITQLAPSGKARIDQRVYDVMSRGQLIEKGSEVEVVEAVGNRIVVAKIVT